LPFRLMEPTALAVGARTKHKFLNFTIYYQFLWQVE